VGLEKSIILLDYFAISKAKEVGMLKIVFIYFDLHTGSYPGFHHGLAYLFGSLKEDNHKVILAHIMEEEDFTLTKNLLEKEKPDLICLSFITNQKKYVKKILDNKGRFSAKLIIAGGTHCSLVKEEVLKEFTAIDGICVGEGEFPLRELCRCLNNSEDYFCTPNFYFRKEGEIIKNSLLPLESIDNLPFPDYSLFNYRKIISESGNCFSMLLGRGCPYNCHYCCNHALKQIYLNKGKYVRQPSVYYAINIIKNNLLLYSAAEKISFRDEIFTMNKEWLSEFCKVYSQEIGLPFTCNGRVETIDEQVVRCLKQAGCASIDFGVESGNEWLRRHILNRKHSNQKIKEVFDLIKGYGINRFSYNMIGLPFETKEMIKETFNLNLELQVNCGGCFYFYPYPGTRLYQLCREYDLLLDNLESVSGYFEAPSLKEHFIGHKEVRKYREIMTIFFHMRLLFSKLKIPFWLERLFYPIVFFLRKPIMIFLNPHINNKAIKSLRKVIRKLAIKFLR